MQITIDGHHLTVTPSIKQNIANQLAQMTAHLDQVNSMQVKLSKDHNVHQHSKKGSKNHIAEVIVRLPGVELFAQANGDDMYLSVKKMCQKLRVQLQRYQAVKAQHFITT